MKNYKVYLFLILVLQFACKQKKDSAVQNTVDKVITEDLSSEFSTFPVCIEKGELDQEPLSAFIFDRDSLFNSRIENMVQFKMLKEQNSNFELLQDQDFAAILMPYKWEKQEFKVAFIGGTLKQKNRVKKTAKKWEDKGNIRFKFGNYKDPDISISFLEGEGSWSYIGKASKDFYPSMNFGWLKDNTPQEEYDRVVLHEFGHALGYIHEHQHPDAGIPWNKPIVYQYYRRLGWSDSQIENNIFRKYDRSMLNYTDFDTKSIMLYAIDNRLTNGNYSTNWNTQISNLDSLLLNIVYP
jgi:hypothetical protein